MTNNYYSFERLEDRGKCARDISGLLEQNNLNWRAFPSPLKQEVFIRPNDPPEENLRIVSRISLQTKYGKINFGVSGYDPHRAIDISHALKSKGYEYHDKGLTEDGRPKGRWWLVKPLYNIESIISEFKDIENIVLDK